MLYEYLSRTKPAEGANLDDQAEQRVLWDLEASLEPQLPELFDPKYSEHLARARDRMRDATD